MSSPFFYDTFESHLHIKIWNLVNFLLDKTSFMMEAFWVYYSLDLVEHISRMRIPIQLRDTKLLRL